MAFNIILFLYAKCIFFSSIVSIFLFLKSSRLLNFLCLSTKANSLKINSAEFEKSLFAYYGLHLFKIGNNLTLAYAKTQCC